ncbi:DUF6252 family protein [Flavobacterium cyanobacteriorum]|uniref:DUF6252 family protein n=1 Tax=Flavobacterium cyanobacteriorum TaxID=2022802 RepID=UPI0013FE256B|nr:DUF6252 family protein [Flavobacterium cyanobacteriorum]
MVTSCQNEPLDSDLLNIQPVQPTGPALFKVDFGGETFVATAAEATVQGTLVTIAGARGTNGETIVLTIAGGVTTGTYNTAVQMYVPSETASAFYSNTNISDGTTNGIVTITNINTQAQTISGTFSFTGHYADVEQNLPAVPFTNGIFQNIPYTGTMPGTGPGPGPGPGPQTEYFRAKVGQQMVDFPDVISLSEFGILSLSGNAIDPMRSLQLVLNANITPGTYSLGFGVPTASINIGTTLYTANTGSLTVISNANGWIKGTFSFNGVNQLNPSNTISITEGSFNVPLE